MNIPFLQTCTYSATVDISEESVGANIYSRQRGTTSVVASSRLAYGVSRDTVTPRVIADRSQELLQHLLKEAKSRGRSCSLDQLQEIQVTVSSPWYSSTFIESSYKNDQPFHVTERLIADISKEANKQTIDTEKFFYESKVHSIKLNGYSVQHAIDREATRMDVSIIAHLFDRSLKDALTRTLTALSHRAHISYVPPGTLYSNAIRYLSGLSESYIFIHVRNESTRILLSRNGEQADTKDVSHGLYHILSINETVDVVDEDMLTVSQKGWLSEIENAFKDLASSQSLPRKVYLSVDGDQHLFFISALKKSTLQQLWYSSDPMTINVIDTTALKRHIDGHDYLAQDVLLTMSALLKGKE